MAEAPGRPAMQPRLASVGIPLLVAACIASTAAYFFLSWVPRQRAAAMRDIARVLATAAERRALVLDRWVADGFEDAATVATFPSASTLLLAPRSGAAAERGHIEGITSDFSRIQGLSRVIVADRSGQPVAGAAGAGAMERQDRELVRAVLESGAPRAEFHLHGDGRPATAFAAPIRSGPPSRVIGAVVAEMDPQQWLYSFLAADITENPTAEAVLVQRTGDSVVFLAPLAKTRAAPMEYRRSLAESQGLAALAALSGGRRFGAYQDYSGSPVFASTRPIAGTPWGLVVKVDQADALSGFRRLVLRSAAEWAAVLLAVAAAAWLLWRRQIRQAEMAVTRGQVRTAAALDQANDMVLFIDLDGVIVGANRRAEEFYGGESGGPRGRHIYELRAPALRAEAEGQFATVKGGAGLVFETAHVDASGAEVPVEVSSRRVALPDGDQIVSVVRDIRERKAAQGKIEKLVRTLRVLSQVNEMMMRETSDRRRVLEETCRVLVEEGGFRMAWIGTAEPDGRTEQVASAGAVDGYLDAASIRWDDTPEGRGPEGTAIREGRAAVVNDCAVDEVYGPWRDLGLARGYRSCAACPIHAGGRAVGVLGVYASNPGAVNDETMALLSQLATDVGFAHQAAAALAERRRAEVRLRESEERFSRMFHTSPIAISLNRLADGAWLEVNDAFVRLSGWSHEELIGRTPEELGLYSQAGQPELIRGGLQRDGRVHDLDLKLQVKSGATVDILASFDVVRFGAERCILGWGLDVTERARMQVELAASEHRFREMFNNMSSGVAVYEAVDAGAEFIVREFNPAAARSTGVRRDEALGRPVSELFPDVKRFGLFAALQRVSHTGVPERHPTDLYQDGRLTFWAENYVFRLPSGEVVAIFDDVSERKKAEEEIRSLTADLERRVAERTDQLAAAVERLESANQELEAFSYSVSHDLRAPLRAIDGYSRMLAEDHADRLDEEGLRLLGVVRDSTASMGRLIDDLLAFSRAGRHELSRTRVDMAALVRTVWLDVTSPLEHEQIVLRVAQLPHADCDASLLRQVWTNLLSNAVKFTAPQPRRSVEVGFRLEGTRTVYIVRDDGVGFDMRYADKLFGVFQRLHSGPQFEGTGVGLALVRRIVQRHGGETWAESAPGEGATFYFALPTEHPGT